MAVDKAQIGGNDNVLCRQVTMETGELGRIERHKLIRHDATASIDNTMLLQGIELERVGKVDAIRTHQLATLQPDQHILRIVLDMTLLVRLLDATS